MFSSELLPIIAILIALYIAAVAFSYWGVRRIRHDALEKDREAKHRLYELAILKEVAERTGYSLNIQKVLDVIVGSLGQFLEYSAVSYMLLSPSKIVFKADIERSVSPDFIKDVRARMLSALSALLARDLAEMNVEETITGAIMLEEINEPVRSFFNIPLVIGSELVGVLTVSHTKEGLYKESDMEMLYKIVGQASQAVTRLEEVVKTEQGKVAAMVESMAEGVIMTDLDYRVIATNPAAKVIIDKEDGTPTIFDFIDAFKGTLSVKEKLEEAIKLDKVVTVDEMFFRNKYYKVVVSPVRGSAGATKGQILGGVIIFHDITSEKEAEKMRSNFTSMMVHELRSPLGNIKKIGELLKSPKVLEDKQESGEYVSMLYESSSSMLDLVNDLLDVARLEAGKFEIDKQPANIQEMIAERVKFFSVAARAASVAVKIIIGAGIRTDVPIDAKRIAQVMDNLLGNALKYTPKGGIVTIGSFVHQQGAPVEEEAVRAGMPWVADGTGGDTTVLPGGLVVAVTDTGFGIAPDDIHKLWNKFVQFESSARQKDHQGTGLGLVIVKGIVEAHGGAVGVASKVGAGSTFYFVLPL